MKKYTTAEVFVPVGYPSVTFVQRPNLERSVISWKMNRSKHLLIFGPSKSGKTSLWKKYIEETNIIKIPCNANKTIKDVYSEILFALDGFYTIERQEENAALRKIGTELKATLGPLTGSLSSNRQSDTKVVNKTERLVPPSLNPNLVIKFLKPTKQIIIIEDFHYANEEFKSNLSQDLKAFSDDECPWIIVGIQHKTSKLLSYNMDLHQRIAEVPVEGFSRDQLREIFNLGEKALNIKFSEHLKDNILNESIGSAALVQNLCQRICIINNVSETTLNTINIDDEQHLKIACKDIAFENKNYYEDVLKNVARGGRSDGSTEKYKWFFKLIRDVDIPELGLRNTEMLVHLRNLGHNAIDQSSVTSGLSYLPKLLKKLSFPAFFDYDPDKKQFYLLDKYMKFVFRWLPEMVDDLFKENLTKEKRSL